jgi:hypothetical protein
MTDRKAPPYVRVKRRNQTVFVDAHPGDTFLSVKEKLAALFHLSGPSQLQLWSGLHAKESKELTDVATLADHDVQNDSVIYMCWKKESAWLSISVFQPCYLPL